MLAACWCTSIGTGLGIHLFARLLPGLIDLPPTPPRLSQSLGMPLLAGALCACGISAVMAWRLARPLSLLRSGFQAAAAGHLETRISPALAGPADEFTGLARDFDGMAQQLQQLMQARQRLLHDVSHELRSPLARLQVACELLQRQPSDPARAVARIEREIARMDALVSDVLTLARIEAGPCPPEAAPVDIGALIDRVVQDAQFEAQASGHTIRWQAPSTHWRLHARAELLRRAVDNVLRNALKHGPPDQPVDVGLQLDPAGRWLCIHIADRGPGLSDEECAAVLQPFVRGGAAAPTGRGAGHGLGLSIAARALQAHGGDLRLQPRTGGGLTAALRLPWPGRTA